MLSKFSKIQESQICHQKFIDCCTSLIFSMVENDFDFLYLYASFLGVWLKVLLQANLTNKSWVPPYDSI